METPSWMHARLYDVFISGPIYIYFSFFIENPFLKLFVFFVGLMAIVYNLHNYLYLNQNQFEKSVIPLVDPSNGKYQVHRLFNLLIMYPLLLYANIITVNKPQWLTIVLYLMIFIGFIFNLYFFVTLS